MNRRTENEIYRFIQWNNARRRTEFEPSSTTLEKYKEYVENRAGHRKRDRDIMRRLKGNSMKFDNKRNKPIF